MLPAEMANVADRTRNQQRNRAQEEEEDQEGGPGPEVVLPGDIGGDEDPLAPPPREEGETLEAYTMRLMQSVTREQLRSFCQMAESMQEMTERNRRPRADWYDSDDPDSDNSDYQDAHDRVRVKRIRKRIQAPMFKGNLRECPEPHLLRATDWFDSQGIRRDVDKVYNFKHTLDGEAREWYADYIRDTGAVPTWSVLINEFSRYYSTQGRGMKNLHDAWRKLSFNPETDDVEEFLRDAQECAKQLRHDDTAIINMLKGAMPKEIYAALFSMENLRDIIKFIKEYYSKNPAERKARQEQEVGNASPFKTIKEDPKSDLTTTLAQLTERWIKWISPKSPTSLQSIPQEEVEAEVEEVDSKEEEVREDNNHPTSLGEVEVEVILEESPEDRSMTRVLQKESPEKTLRPKMLTKINADIAEKLVIGSKIAPKRRRTKTKTAPVMLLLD